MSSHESAPTFKVNVRLVQVRVVVRDSHGNAIGNLHKEDFQLLDDGKPQAITKFNFERPGITGPTQEGSTTAPAPANSVSNDGARTPAPDLADHYIAYVFDDVNLKFGDLARVREAAQKQLVTLQASARAAIFTTSAQGNLDFTDDRKKLNDALLRLTLHPASGAEDPNRCPRMTYYIAYRMEQGDADAGAAMTADALSCQFDNDPRFQRQAAAIADAAQKEVFSKGNMQSRIALSSIKDILHRVSMVPGQRSIVLVSPGFLAYEQESDVNEIVDRAVNANITISALDARGLYALVPGGEASETGTVNNPATAALIFRYQRESASADSDVMEEFADGTGGSFFQNNNDLEGGLRRVASTPEFYYVLGFTPQNLKLDGRFHKLKVTLNSGLKYSVQARRGYFAPKHATDPNEQAKQEIEEALFSQEEMHDLPVELQTQFFKPSNAAAKLTVLARIDVRPLHFQKVAGRNNDNLTIVSGVFDRNGNFVTGSQKTLEMHLRDETLAAKLDSGLSVRSTFDVKPGGYLVRVVVRDEEGQIAAQNGTIQIP